MTTKYLVLDEPANGRNGDIYVLVCDDLETANWEAEKAWNRLTKREKQNRCVYVALVTEDELSSDAFGEDGTIDWTHWAACTWHEKCWSSERRNEDETY